MTFDYEQLGPDRFQQFAQALILSENPGLQCLPIGQPDGGRDAFVSPFLDDEGGLVVYQIKFVKNPARMIDPHKWLLDIVQSESPKVAQLLPKRIRSYYLVTNISGTAHLDAGSIDKMQKILDDTMPVPSMAWWRDDLDRRTEIAPRGLRWSYPEILRGTDVLELLVDSDLSENSRRRQDAIRAFITTQYDVDEEVRFKQVQLQNDLLSLFIDVPAVIERSPRSRRGRHKDAVALGHLYDATSARQGSDPRDLESGFWFEDGIPQFPIGAAALLLSEFGQERLSFVVVSGAPGQGKSTLAQFLCQVYRMRIRSDERLKDLPAQYCQSGLRLPVKVDLTEFAEWLSGRDPFDIDRDAIADQGATTPIKPNLQRLEAFVAALIHHGSGGAEFTVADLHAVLRSSSVLLVLDGLDEVAETKRRDQVIKEINAASKRLSDLSPGIQIVVTTRPSAFAGVAEFSARHFYTLQLVSLGTSLIQDYVRRWTSVRRISSGDARKIRKGLQSRLSQAHVRDLARNPMQLAILLSVVHSRGESLPDKRTALYDIYVELFLAREAEKTAVVREHNELLVDVHQYIAYTLQALAESSGQLGRISRDSLMEVLRSYLIREGRDPNLADELFRGAQRVVFLVARVEGTFEFEVQPLREYFAGKYLYSTSPYSPPGNEKSGTMPDRFDVLCRNPYWLNVTRFFAGSLNKGELPALVDRIQALAGDQDFSSIAYPRYLAATLLADWVFSQHQRSMHEVVAVVLDGAGLRELVRRRYGTRRDVFALPDGAGRAELVNNAFESLNQLEIGHSASGVAHLLRQNSTRDELVEHWSKWFDRAPDCDHRKWLAIAHYLGIMREIDDVRVTRAFDSDEGTGSVRWLYLGLREDAFRSAAVFDRLFEAMLDGDLPTFPTVNSSLKVVLQFFSPMMHRTIFITGLSIDISMGEAVAAAYRRNSPGRTIDIDVPPGSRYAEALSHCITTCERVAERSVEEWRKSVQLWSRVIEPIRAVSGSGRRAIFQAALSASFASDPLAPDERRAELLNESSALAPRLRAARLRAGNSKWWRDQLSMIRTGEDQATFVSAFVLMAGPTVVIDLAPELDELLMTLSEKSLDDLLAYVALASSWNSPWSARRRMKVRALPEGLSDLCIAVLALTVPQRVGEEIVDRYFTGFRGTDPLAQAVYLRSLVAAPVDDSAKWLEIVRVVDINPKNRYLSSVGRMNSMALHNRQPEVQMPIGLAQIVLDKEDYYPSVLTDIAAHVCENHLFENAEPLALIAERENWFGNL